jgi:hypothetical protein
MDGTKEGENLFDGLKGGLVIGFRFRHGDDCSSFREVILPERRKEKANVATSGIEWEPGTNSPRLAKRGNYVN